MDQFPLTCSKIESVKIRKDSHLISPSIKIQKLLSRYKRMICSLWRRITHIDQNPFWILGVKVEQVIEIVTSFSSIPSKEVYFIIGNTCLSARSSCRSKLIEKLLSNFAPLSSHYNITFLTRIEAINVIGSSFWICTPIKIDHVVCNCNCMPFIKFTYPVLAE